MKKKEPVLTKDLRAELKEVMHKEISQLSKTLRDLQPTDRINVICKLMPFVVPKVETVSHSINEPMDFDINI